MNVYTFSIASEGKGVQKGKQKGTHVWFKYSVVGLDSLDLDTSRCRFLFRSQKIEVIVSMHVSTLNLQAGLLVLSIGSIFLHLLNHRGTLVVIAIQVVFAILCPPEWTAPVAISAVVFYSSFVIGRFYNRQIDMRKGSTLKWRRQLKQPDTQSEDLQTTLPTK